LEKDFEEDIKMKRKFKARGYISEFKRKQLRDFIKNRPKFTEYKTLEAYTQEELLKLLKEYKKKGWREYRPGEAADPMNRCMGLWNEKLWRTFIYRKELRRCPHCNKEL